MTIVAPEFLALGPIVIGAVGGSGTRAVAKIVRDGGVYLGRKISAEEDSAEIGRPCRRWIDKFLRAEQSGTLDALFGEMAADLQPVFENFLAPLRDQPAPWGWKAPRSIYLLPFFHAVFPALRFVHVVRDGRDMAFSSNQHQLRDYGDIVLSDLPNDTLEPVRAMALWSRLNLKRAEFGERELGQRYLRIRFEDLCAQPAETVDRLLRFVGASGDANAIAEKEISPPDTLGRWRSQDRHLIDELNRVGEAALRKFGYA